MFQAGIKKSFDARHFLRGDFAEESVPHTHPYQVEVICGAGELDKNGFSVDIALLEDVLSKNLEAIDGVLLNDLDFFARRQPSLENLAVYLWERIRGDLEAACRLESGPLPSSIEIKIWESVTAWAAYAAPLT